MWNEPGDPGGDIAPGASPPGDTPRGARWSPSSTLMAGLRLSLLLRQDLRRLPVSPGPFWSAVLVSLACELAVDYFTTSPPVMFSKSGLENAGFYLLASLFVCHVLARRSANRVPLWPLAAIITYASIIPGTLDALVYTYALDPDVGGNWYYVLFFALFAWIAALFWRALSGFGADDTQPRRVGLSIAAAAWLGGCAYVLPSSGLWETDYQRMYKNRPPEQRLVAEDVLSRQQDLLGKALAGIAPGQPGKTHLYFLSYAPYATQGVFSKEAHYTVHQFETRFGAQGRALALVNSLTQTDTQPLATVTNLRATLQALGRKMIPDQDILFLFLTSHGSRDGQLAEELPGVSLDTLDGKRLSGLLEEAGIRWRVIVVSSCYSGNFVAPLQNDHTLIMTAARGDRTSFGCSNEEDFTYFGRAYFQKGLNQTASFTDAFAIARKLIDQWETEKKLEHAEPQIAVGQLMPAKLEAWRATLPAAASVPADTLVQQRDAAAAATAAVAPPIASVNAASAASPPAENLPAPNTPSASASKQPAAVPEAKTMRRYVFAASAKIILSLLVVGVLLVVQWRLWRRHRHRSLLLLSISSLIALALVFEEILTVLHLLDRTRSLGIYFVMLATAMVELLVGAWGSLALLRDYDRLASHQPPSQQP